MSIATVATESAAGPIAELVKQVQEGGEVLFTQGDAPIAKLVAVDSREELDAQQTADVLGASVDFVTRLLLDGEIDHHGPAGNLRMYLKDVLEYRRSLRDRMKHGIRNLAQQAVDLGVYDVVVPPEP